MALLVEDGSGVAGAVTYVDVGAFRAYWLARGVELTQTDAELEADLVDSCDWLDGFPYDGQRATTAQRTAWPRKNVVVRYGNPRLDPGTVVPSDAILQVLQEAQCEAARANRSERLQREVDEAKLLAEKGVGSLKKRFHSPAGRRRLTAVERLLAGLYDDGRRASSALILRS